MDIESLLRDVCKKYNISSHVSVHIFDEKITSYNENYLINGSFPLGSCGKAMFCYLCEILDNKGIIDLINPIKHVVPEFKTSRTFSSEELCISDLLNHRWCLKTYPFNLICYPGGDLTDKDFFEFSSHFKEVGSLRTEYSYSNYAYALAGKVVEKWTGKSLEELFKEFIFNPLSMTETMINAPSEKQMPLWKKNIFFTLEPCQYVGSSGIYTTIKDLYKWIKMLTISPLLPLKHHKKILSIKTVMPSSDQSEHTWIEGYGSGWKIKNVDKFKVFTHSGETCASSSKLIIIPGLNKSIFLFSNSFQRSALNETSQIILDSLLFSITPKVCISPLSHSHLEYRLMLPEEFSHIHNRFKNPGLGKLKIEREDQSVFLKFEKFPKLNGPLFVKNSEIFCCPDSLESPDIYYSVVFSKSGVILYSANFFPCND
jgi:CubicO group peptidase (beta-lactamase class C family)